MDSDSELSMSKSPDSLSIPEESPMNTQDTDVAMSLDTPPDTPRPSPAPEDLESSYEQKLVKLTTRNLVNNFTIIHDIGSGSFGKVIEVVHNYDLQHYAVKVIPLDPNKNIDEIRQEAEHLSELKHDNVVGYKFSWIDDYCLEDIPMADSKDYNANRIHDDNHVRYGLRSKSRVSSSQLSSRSKFHFCILMELCQTNLEQVIRKGLHKQPFRAWHFFRQIVAGLHYLHSNNIIHADLKPANVFIKDNDCVKIGDLGISFKKAYIPSVKEHYTPATDIKDLGLMVGEMFGLKTIVKEGTELEEEENMQQNCLIANTNTNPRVLMRWLLNPETRPTSAQLVDYQNNLHSQVPRNHILFEHRNANHYRSILVHTDAFCNKKSKTKLDNIFGHSV